MTFYDIFGTKVYNLLKFYFVISDQHLVQFIGLVKLILYPCLLWPRAITQPHSCTLCRVQVIKIQFGTIDHIVRSPTFLRAGDRGGHLVNSVKWRPDILFVQQSH
jgi:hypothetical protein